MEPLVPPSLEKRVINGNGKKEGEGEDGEEDEELTNTLPSRPVYMNGTSNHVHEDINSVVEDLDEAR